MHVYRHLPLLGLLFLLAVSACKKDSDENIATQSIPIAGLFSLTGDWSNLGITSKAALEIAIEEINADFANRNLPYRFSLSVYDTKLDPALAVSGVSGFAASNYKLVIGPQSSAEVAAIKPLADSLGMLVVSQGSTASTLAVPNDAVFRYCPGDQIEGQAMANTMYSSGKQAIVTLARNDAGNLGLQSSVTNFFQGLGGTVVTAGNYATNETDFTSILTAIRTQVLAWSSMYSSSQIGVYLASFDEAVQLFHQAAGDSVLQSVNWYGGDGFIKNAALLNDTSAAGFAYATQFFSPEFGLPASAQAVWQPLKTKIINRCGLEPDAFALAAYDAIKVMAKLVESNGGVPASGSTLQNAFYTLSNQHTGATGAVLLNASGDRANGSFDYWGLSYNNGTYAWTQVGQSQ